jgi:hypothetical protein
MSRKKWLKEWLVAVGCLFAIGNMTMVVIGTSSAKAYSWWSGWDSYAECTGYYVKNLPSLEGVEVNVINLAQEIERRCRDIKAKEDQKLHEQEETRRLIILGCRAGSVSYDQFAACVVLATGQ